MIGIFVSQNEFNKEKPFLGYKEKAVTNEVNLELKDLAVGWYMISIYHDLNVNEKLDKNILGIPLEPYGVFRKEQGMFAPSYEKSKFYYDGKKMNVEIRLQ